MENSENSRRQVPLTITLHFPTKSTQVLGPALLLVCAWLFYIFEPSSFKWLAYNRPEIEDWQLWRLLSANLLHTNLNHLLLNSAGLLLIWALHGNHYSWQTFLSLFSICALFTCIGLWFFTPDMRTYVGLSGVIHGLFAWGAIKDIRSGLKSGWLLLIGVIAKILHEQLIGPSAEISNLIDASVAIDAHLYGFIGGLCFVCLSYFIHNKGKL